MDALESRIREIRRDFPLLNDKTAYLDNAATTQKPRCVLDAWKEFYEQSNANPFRGVYDLSEAATEKYERARESIAEFIHAGNSSEIIFTRNASESLNLVAYSYALTHLKPGDELVVSVMEHHSNFLPWKMAAKKTGAVIRQLSCSADGSISKEQLLAALNKKTRLLAITQASNVFGNANNLKTIIKAAHECGAVAVVDGAQSVPHMRTDVTELDVDFLAFSGHKMLAPMGIGVLYGKQELLDEMEPFMYGGEMIETVHWDSVRYAKVPHRFEAGTVNAAGAVALEAAVKYIRGVGFDTIRRQEGLLVKTAMGRMKEIPGVRIIGSDNPDDHRGIITFTVDGVHPHDIASILNADGVCVRAGHHCAQPLMDYLGIHSAARVSFCFYNTLDEANRFADSLETLRRRMGYEQ